LRSETYLFRESLEKSVGSSLPSRESETVRDYLSQRTAGRSASRSRAFRASVRIFLETDERGQFRRRVGSPPTSPTWFAPILTDYLRFVQVHRGLAPKTVRKYTQKLSVFAHYLERAGITQLGGITPEHVREFYENAKNGVPRRSYGSTLRVFVRWASAQGWVSSFLGEAIPRPRQYKHVSLPDLLSQSDVHRILAAVDRSTKTGSARLCHPSAGRTLWFAPL